MIDLRSAEKGGRLASLFLSFKPNLIVGIAFLLLQLSTPAFAQSPLSGFNPATIADGTNGVFLEGKTFLADNALPLQAIFFDKWEGPFRPDERNNLDVYWKTDAGFLFQGWRFAGFHRGELFAEANRDTLEILRMTNLKEELPVGRVFEIDMKGKGFSAFGAEISKGVSLESLMDGLSMGLTARYMVGEKVQKGRITGNATATGPNTYDFDLFLDYIYDENLIYKRRDVTPGSGEGYSFDLGFKYEFSKRFGAEILWRDIWGRIYWKDVPFTTADATSDTKGYDEEGYQVYRPTIRGYEGYKDFVQKVPLKTDVTIFYEEGPFTITPTVNFIEDRPLYWIDLGYRITEKFSINAGYNTNYRAFSIGTSYKKTLLSFYSSDIDLNKTNAIGLKLAVQYEW